jgi:hypothetical protein
MGTTLIFVGLLEVTAFFRCTLLSDFERAITKVQEITPAYRPYPKPTQVDW